MVAEGGVDFGNFMATSQHLEAKQRVDASSGNGDNDGVKQKAPKSRVMGAGAANLKQEPLTSSAQQQQQTGSGWNLTTIKEGGKRSKPEAPKFLLLLYQILETESARVIRWSEDGLAVQILDPVVVTEQVLPKYFNHTNFHSFQRQLNYFGFRKWTKSKTDICTFSHPFFRENQPELLQLIKRKKAPRRTTQANTSTTTTTASPSAPTQQTTAKSPCGKRKLPSDATERDNTIYTGVPAGMHIQMNASHVAIQPAINGVPLGSMTTPHAASSSSLGFSTQDPMTRQFLPGPALLNNVISPVAATESKKKAKKLDKKDYLASATLHAPLTSPTDSAMRHSVAQSASIAMTNGNNGVSSAPLSNSSTASSDIGTSHGQSYGATPLPTLDCVRSRIIRRQQGGGVSGMEQSQQFDYNPFPNYASTNGAGSVGSVASEQRPEILASSLPMARKEQGPGSNTSFSNSFSDPVNILLRIKKSRSASGEGADVTSTQEQAGDENENLASLHNFLLGHSLYTNRLETQLKFMAEENEGLKRLLDAKQREVDTLQGDRKALQHENSVLLEDKNKLFEINRDLLGKLFPQ